MEQIHEESSSVTMTLMEQHFHKTIMSQLRKNCVFPFQQSVEKHPSI